MFSIDYFLTGIWKENNIITNLFIHTTKDNILHTGRKASLTEVLQLISRGSNIMALRWDYKAGGWKYISTVAIKSTNGSSSLFCQTSDMDIELCNLINMGAFQPAQVSVPLVKKRIAQQ